MAKVKHLTDKHIERLIGKHEDLKYKLEGEQGDIQDCIEEREAAGKNIDALNKRFEAVCHRIEEVEDEINDLNEESDRRANLTEFNIRWKNLDTNEVHTIKGIYAENITAAEEQAKTMLENDGMGDVYEIL